MKRWFRKEKWDEGMTRRNEAEMEEVDPSESPYLLCAVVRREKGGDEGKKSTMKDRWDGEIKRRSEERCDKGMEGWGGGVFQKDHLSCVRGSVFREGDSGGFWVLLSSPFNPFLHTGHVSCCRKRERRKSVPNVFKTFLLLNITPPSSSPFPARVLYSLSGRSGCRAAVWRALPLQSPPCTPDTPYCSLERHTPLFLI